MRTDIIPNYESVHSEAIPWSFILGSKAGHKELILKLLKTMSRTAIAKHLGVSIKGLSIKMTHEGIPPLKKMVPIKIKITELKNSENMTTKEIAKAIGHRVESVARTCRRHKIPYKRVLKCKTSN